MKKRTGYHGILQATVKKIFREQPEFFPIALEIEEKLNTGFYNPRFVNAFAQDFYYDFDVVDAYLWGQFWAELLTGELLFTSIDIGHEPESDKGKHNEQILTDLKNHPFFHAETDEEIRVSATWVGSNNIGDGNFRWKGAVKFNQWEGAPNKVKTVEVQNGNVMLEVGYTKSTTTMLHLLESTGLARWPYNSTEISVFVRPDEYRPSLPEWPFVQHGV
jgi:hypothetical protein